MSMYYVSFFLLIINFYFLHNFSSSLVQLLGRHQKYEGNLQMPRSEWVLFSHHVLATISTLSKSWWVLFALYVLIPSNSWYAFIYILILYISLLRGSSGGKIWCCHSRENNKTWTSQGKKEGLENTNRKWIGFLKEITRLLSSKWDHWLSW